MGSACLLNLDQALVLLLLTPKLQERKKKKNYQRERVTPGGQSVSLQLVSLLRADLLKTVFTNRNMSVAVF